MSALPTSSVLARLEDQLREIWDAPPHSSEAPKARVCTMNLVVVANSKEVGDRYTSVVDNVTASIPSRAIVITLIPDAQESILEGDATAVCGIGEGGGDVLCSERVRLTATGEACVRAGSAVEALLVPELPTTLVWLGKVNFNDACFRSIAANAQRIVLDTEYTSLSDLIQLHRWVAEQGLQTHIADLAWTRLAPWQEMCARFFDEPPLRDHAMHVTRLALTQASEAKAPLGSEGALLFGWLATRLGWKARRQAEQIRFERDDGHAVQVELQTTSRPPQVAPAALAMVALTTELNGKTAHGTLERDLASGRAGSSANADVLVWRLDVDQPSATEQRVRLSTDKVAHLLETTLRRPPEDPTLAESITFAESIFRDGLRCN